MRRDLGVEAVGREAQARAGLFENVAQLRAMQFGVGRHRGEARVPDGVHGFEIVGAVLRRDCDALAGCEPHRFQRTGKPRDAGCNIAVAAQHARTQAERGTLRVFLACTLKPRSEIHDNAIFSVSKSTNLDPSP